MELLRLLDLINCRQVFTTVIIIEEKPQLTEWESEKEMLAKMYDLYNRSYILEKFRLRLHFVFPWQILKKDCKVSYNNDTLADVVT